MVDGKLIFLSYQFANRLLYIQINRDKDPIFGRNPFMLTGDQWKEKRAEITPAFTPTRVIRFVMYSYQPE